MSKIKQKNRLDAIRKPRQLQSQNRLYTQDSKSSLKAFQSSKRILSNLSTTDIPGPGSYRVRSMFDENRGFTVPQAEIETESKAQKKPSPWTYSPQQLNFKPKSPAAVIGKQRKFQKIVKLPGPTDYKVDIKILFRSTRRPIFGTQPRANLTELKILPGPTDYQNKKGVQLSKSSKGAIIGNQQRHSVNPNHSPSPNQYSVSGQFETNIRLKKGFSIGKRFHIKTEEDRTSNYIRYDSIKDLTMKKAPAFTIQKSQKLMTLQSLSPGPAAYCPPSVHFDKGPIIPRSSRTPRENHLTPGPVDYQIRPSRQGPAFSIPKSSAIQKKQSKFPGPANYSPVKPQSEKFKSVSMGYRSRNNTIDIDSFPGPGQYKLQIPKQKSFTIKKQARNYQSVKKQGPGPAAYKIDFAAIKKHISIKKV